MALGPAELWTACPVWRIGSGLGLFRVHHVHLLIVKEVHGHVERTGNTRAKRKGGFFRKRDRDRAFPYETDSWQFI